MPAPPLSDGYSGLGCRKSCKLLKVMFRAIDSEAYTISYCSRGRGSTDAIAASMRCDAMPRMTNYCDRMLPESF